MRRKALGFVVNPIAGLGGKYALKGSDDPREVRKLLKEGARLVAPSRAVRALGIMLTIKSRIEIFTYPDEMGEQAINEVGLRDITQVKGKIKSGCTTSNDTKKAVLDFMNLGADLVAFVGGDGTACDVLDAVDEQVPILGIPAGVKMYSGVFAASPEAAGQIIMQCLWEELPLVRAEVIDVDESAIKRDEFRLNLHGYALVPSITRGLQGSKAPSLSTENETGAQKSIAKRVVEELQHDVVYILGPGTTVQAVANELSLSKTLFGIDLIQNRNLVAKDVTEKEILKKIQGKESKIILSPIGRQGFLIGRGNQQISPQVLKHVGLDNLIVLATPEKLSTFEFLRVDTGNKELDTELSGRWIKVTTSYHETKLMKILPFFETR